MFQRPHDYDQAPSYGDEYARLSAGGYLCTIKKVEEGTTQNGIPIIHVYFDISEGGMKGYYERLYKANKNNSRDTAPVKWKGIYDIFPKTRDDQTSGAWKGFLENIERSNGYKINWSADYDQFRGKKIGLLFREEEYMSRYDGSKRTIVKACASRPYDVIRDGDFEIPAKKGMKVNNNVMPTAQNDFTNVTVDDDELPF